MEKIEYFSQTTGALTKTQGPNQLYQTSDKSTYYNVQALLDYKLNLGEKHHLSFLEEQPKSKGCFLMSYVHLAHDCHVGDGVIISNGTQLAGHVTIDERAIRAVWSPCTNSRRSDGTASSAAARASQGRPALREGGRQPDQAVRAELGGLERNGFPDDVRRELKRAYRLFFKSELNLSQARERAAPELQPFPEIEEFLAFFERSDRGSVV